MFAPSKSPQRQRHSHQTREGSLRSRTAALEHRKVESFFSAFLACQCEEVSVQCQLVFCEMRRLMQNGGIPTTGQGGLKRVEGRSFGQVFFSAEVLFPTPSIGLLQSRKGDERQVRDDFNRNEICLCRHNDKEEELG